MSLLWCFSTSPSPLKHYDCVTDVILLLTLQADEVGGQFLPKLSHSAIHQGKQGFVRNNLDSVLSCSLSTSSK